MCAIIKINNSGAKRLTSYNKSQQDTLFLNFISVKNSKCDGHTYCLNTVFTATGICHSEMLKMGKITTVYVCMSASCKMGTGSFPGVKCGRGLLLTTHLLLVSRSWKGRAILLPTLWGHTGPVTGSLYLLYICVYVCMYVYIYIYMYMSLNCKTCSR